MGGWVAFGVRSSLASPIIHKDNQLPSAQDDRAEWLLRNMITVYRAGRGTPGETEGVERAKEDFRGHEEPQDEGVAKRVEMKERHERSERQRGEESEVTGS